VKVDEDWQQLNAMPTGVIRCSEAREQFTEVRDKFRSQWRGIEMPPPSKPSTQSGAIVTSPVSQAIGEDEPAHDADTQVDEVLEVLIDVVVPPWAIAACAPGWWSKTEIPTVVEPGVIDTDLHVRFT
jgi:hypothetical protein